MLEGVNFWNILFPPEIHSTKLIDLCVVEIDTLSGWQTESVLNVTALDKILPDRSSGET